MRRSGPEKSNCKRVLGTIFTKLPSGSFSNRSSFLCGRKHLSTGFENCHDGLGRWTSRLRRDRPIRGQRHTDHYCTDHALRPLTTMTPETCAGAPPVFCIFHLAPLYF